MFHFAMGRSLAPKTGAAPVAVPAVPGLDYYDAETVGSREEPFAALSPEHAALEQAFGYWSEA